MKTGIVLSVLLIVFYAPWGLLVVMGYWAVFAAQRYRARVQEESGDNFENKNSLGLPFTSRW